METAGSTMGMGSTMSIRFTMGMASTMSMGSTMGMGIFRLRGVREPGRVPQLAFQALHLPLHPHIRPALLRHVSPQAVFRGPGSVRPLCINGSVGGGSQVSAETRAGL